MCAFMARIIAPPRASSRIGVVSQLEFVAASQLKYSERSASPALQSFRPFVRRESGSGSDTRYEPRRRWPMQLWLREDRDPFPVSPDAYPHPRGKYSRLRE